MGDMLEEMIEEMEEGLSPEEVKCFEDTEYFQMFAPGVEKAYMKYMDTATYNDSMENMVGGEFGSGIGDKWEMGYSDEGVSMLRKACDNSQGHFSIIEETDLKCTMEGQHVNLKMTNVADCLANTVECQNFNVLKPTENLWKEFDLDCEDNMHLTMMSSPPAAKSS